MKLPIRQTGAALVVSLLILLVLTILALTTTHTSIVDSKIAYNMQLQKEAEAAAQQCIENFISDPVNFDRTTVFPCTIGLFTVNIAVPQCLGLIVSTAPPPTVIGSQPNPCQAGVNTPGFSCWQSFWDIEASVTPTTGAGLGASAIFHQGITIRYPPNRKPLICRMYPNQS